MHVSTAAPCLCSASQRQSFSLGILPPELTYADLQVMCGDYKVLKRAVVRKGLELSSPKVRMCLQNKFNRGSTVRSDTDGAMQNPMLVVAFNYLC